MDWSQLIDFEFFVRLVRVHEGTLECPPAVFEAVKGWIPDRVLMRAAACCRERWSVKAFVDAEGRPFLGRGWERFTSSHNL
jgi:hypothetical protein